MNTWVIGDVQGCYAELQHLLARIAFDRDKDELWFVGDLINRGPDNVGVMDFVMNLPSVVCVLGNHDLHFLAIALGQQSLKHGDTVDDLLRADGLQDYISWLRSLPLLHVSPQHDTVLVHAGLPPQLDLSRCRALAREVEDILSSDQCEAFLSAMYGNEPDTWDEQLKGMVRLRVITNYFTRLRYCTASGRMELTHKTDIAPPGYDPWFNFERRGNERVIFGHWAALEGKTGVESAINLDTGCVWGRSLTAMNLVTGERVAVPAKATAP